MEQGEGPDVVPSGDAVDRARPGAPEGTELSKSPTTDAGHEESPQLVAARAQSAPPGEETAEPAEASLGGEAIAPSDEGTPRPSAESLPQSVQADASAASPAAPPRLGKKFLPIAIGVGALALVLIGVLVFAAVHPGVAANSRGEAIRLCRAHVTEFVAKADGWSVDSWPADDDVEMAAASTYILFKTDDNEKAKVEIWHIYEAVMVGHEGQTTPVAYGCAAFVPVEIKGGSNTEGFAVFTADNEIFPGGE